MDKRTDQNARRAYWARMMDEADIFMQEVRRQPVRDCGEPLVSLVEAADAAQVEVEFTVTPHVRGLPRLYLLREGLIPAFLAAAREMGDRGWIMRVEDGFRTREMQKYLALESYTFDVILERVLWELGEIPPPELMFRRVSALIAACPKVGTHMSGSAIDISVIERDSRHDVNRGGAYLEMSELTPMDSPFIAADARENRAAITTLMARHGFVAYPWEFWHYNSGDAYAAVLHRTPEPARYGAIDIDACMGSVQPIQDPLADLNSLDEIRHVLQHALDRRTATIRSS